MCLAIQVSQSQDAQVLQGRTMSTGFKNVDSGVTTAWFSCSQGLWLLPLEAGLESLLFHILVKRPYVSLLKFLCLQFLIPPTRQGNC